MATEIIDSASENEVSAAYTTQMVETVVVNDPDQANYFTVGHRHIPILMVLEKPMIVLMQDFLSPLECDELMAMSKVQLARSTVVSPEDGTDVVDEIRTSDGCCFARGENALVARIEERIAAITELHVDRGEGIQVLHYGPGQEYKPHFDYFTPENKGEAEHIKDYGQRIGTFIMYLNDVPSGGATTFTKLGLHIAPKKGQALYFRYQSPADDTDMFTLHAGMPVETGEKWIATKWLRDKDYFTQD